MRDSWTHGFGRVAVHCRIFPSAWVGAPNQQYAVAGIVRQYMRLAWRSSCGEGSVIVRRGGMHPCRRDHLGMAQSARDSTTLVSGHMIIMVSEPRREQSIRQSAMKPYCSNTNPILYY